MTLLRRLGPSLTTMVLLGASVPVPPEGDPVLQARAQRAAALNIPEDDLPPVPRGIVEPPPLPPPEIHPKDLRGRRGSRKQVKKGAKKRTPTAKKNASAKGGKKKG